VAAQHIYFTSTGRSLLVLISRLVSLLQIVHVTYYAYLIFSCIQRLE